LFQAHQNVRYIIFRLAGIKIIGRCVIWGPLTIRPIGAAKNIEIGQGTFINTEVRFGVPETSVIIGQNVQIGPRVMFETLNHSLKYKKELGRSSVSKKIIVKNEVWIGAGAIITQGVTIGQGAVVAAGAVVNRDVEAHTLVAGVPARFIRAVED